VRAARTTFRFQERDAKGKGIGSRRQNPFRDTSAANRAAQGGGSPARGQRVWLRTHCYRASEAQRGKGHFPRAPIRAAKHQTQNRSRIQPASASLGTIALDDSEPCSTITKSASLCSDCYSPSLRNVVRLPSGIDVHLHRNTHSRHSGIIVQEDLTMGPWRSRTTERDDRFGDVSAEARRMTYKIRKGALPRTRQLTASIKNGTRKHVFWRVVLFVLRNEPPTDRASVPKVRTRASRGCILLHSVLIRGGSRE
jgi:hypothetical protein